MERLWAPWRMEYILSDKSGGCFLCDAAESRDDRASLVLTRGTKAFGLLNRYPYNNGHLMVCPRRHVAAMEELDGGELDEMMRMLVELKLLLDKVMRPDGYNVGINLGAAAGAGLEEHIHVHLVPRWRSDSNFMPVLGDTKVIPQHLDELWAQLKGACEA